MRLFTCAVVLGLSLARPASAFVLEATGDDRPARPSPRPVAGGLDGSGYTERPEPRVEPARPEAITLAANRVRVRIRDQVAVVEVDHLIQSNVDRVLQARYELPLGPRAHVTGYAIWEKGVKVQGELMEVARAEKLYKAVTNQELATRGEVAQKVHEFRWSPPRDPGLLRQKDGSTFDTHIYPVMPWTLRQVRVLYSELVEARDGWCSFAFPLEAAARFENPIGEVSFEVVLDDTAGIEEVRCEGASVERREAGFVVRFAARDLVPRGPFVVGWRPRLRPGTAAVLAHRRAGEPGHALVRVALPASQAPADEPLDVVLAVDRSGSMRGPKRDVQDSALRALLATLGERDTLSLVVQGSHEARVEAGHAWARVGRAGEALSRAVPSGRGSLAGLLRHGLDALGTRRAGRARLLVLASDGVTDEDDARDALALEPTGARLLVVATGYDDDQLVLGRLADRHGGTVFVPGSGERTLLWPVLSPDLLREPYGVLPGGEVALAPIVARLREPAVTGARLEGEGLEDVYAATPGPLAPGGTASFLLRSGREGAARARFVAFVGGERVDAEVSLELPREQAAHRFVASFWAKARIRELLRLEPIGDDDPNRAEVVALALEHRLVTPYTALLSLPDSERRRLGIGPVPRDDAHELYTFAAATPEAETWLLLAIGLVVVAVATRRRNLAFAGGAS